MSRFIVQSSATGRFLVPGAWSPEWVRLLSEAGGGIVPDREAADQLLEEHCDLDDECIVVDLDAVLEGT